MICSREEYQQFVGRITNLCVDGMVSSDYCRLFKINFDASRRQLFDCYDDFLACCTWLSSCDFDEYATHYSPGSDRLLARVNKALGRSVPHGALIAAVLYLELPHVMPGNSPGLAVGVSRFCSSLYASS
jgi:hypothetical protein